MPKSKEAIMPTDPREIVGYQCMLFGLRGLEIVVEIEVLRTRHAQFTESLTEVSADFAQEVMIETGWHSAEVVDRWEVERQALYRRR